MPEVKAEGDPFAPCGAATESVEAVGIELVPALGIAGMESGNVAAGSEVEFLDAESEIGFCDNGSATGSLEPKLATLSRIKLTTWWVFSPSVDFGVSSDETGAPGSLNAGFTTDSAWGMTVMFRSKVEIGATDGCASGAASGAVIIFSPDEDVRNVSAFSDPDAGDVIAEADDCIIWPPAVVIGIPLVTTGSLSS